MAAGRALTTARQLHELQPSAKHGQRWNHRLEPRARPVSAGQKLASAATEGCHPGPAGGANWLAASVGDSGLGGCDGRLVRLEVRTVPAPSRLRGHGLLPPNCQRRRRDTEAQHGSGSLASLPEYADVAPVHQSPPLRPLRRQYQFPQGIINNSICFFTQSAHAWEK